MDIIEENPSLSEDLSHKIKEKASKVEMEMGRFFEGEAAEIGPNY